MSENEHAVILEKISGLGREIKLRHDSDKEASKARHDNINKKLVGILNAQIKTNGRVKKLEIWRAFIAGGLAILTTIFAILKLT